MHASKQFRPMIRLGALAIVLALAGAPAATAACLVWCASPCPEPMTTAGVTISPSQATCGELVLVGPSVREDSRRSYAGSSTSHLAVEPQQFVGFAPEYAAADFLISREHAPPIHQKPPTVLLR